MRLLAAVLALGPLTAQAEELSPLARFGAALFINPALSMNQNQSCASCHAVNANFAGPADDVVQKGGVVEGSVPGQFGNRKPPSVAYAGFSPVFHHAMADGAPLFMGGLFFDGRATGGSSGDPLRDQARAPILNPVEMALPSPVCLTARLCGAGLEDFVDPAICEPEKVAALQAPCATPGLVASLSDEQLDAAEQVLQVVTAALAAYERSPEVNRFSSRFDRGDLTEAEVRGAILFDRKAKCAACHIDTGTPDGTPALFTDFTFDNLGVPANPETPGEREDPAVEGLAGTLAQDAVYDMLAPMFAGKQKVPTLRNLMSGHQRTYMHNGYFHSLEGVVRFYNTRDIWPRCTDSLTDIQALVAKCWPAPEVEATVNHDELGNLSLTEAEEADLVAFLRSLDDQ